MHEHSIHARAAPTQIEGQLRPVGGISRGLAAAEVAQAGAVVGGVAALGLVQQRQQLVEPTGTQPHCVQQRFVHQDCLQIFHLLITTPNSSLITKYWPQLQCSQ